MIFEGGGGGEQKPIRPIDVGTYFRLSLAKGGFGVRQSKQNLLTFQICVVHTTCPLRMDMAYAAREGEGRRGRTDQQTIWDNRDVERRVTVTVATWIHTEES